MTARQAHTAVGRVGAPEQADALAREAAFQVELGPEKIATTRVSSVLAIVLYASFGILDIWAIPSSLGLVWTIRALVIAVLCGILLATFRPFFVARYRALMALMYLSVGFGIEAMVYLAAPDEIARFAYYSGLMLVVYALYTWSYLDTLSSLVIGLTLIMVYLYIAIAVQHMNNPQEWPILLANAFFFVSANVIGFVGGGMRNRFARETHRLRNALERELEQTIAERRASESAYLRRLEHSEALKSAIIDTAPVSLITVDADGSILQFNPSAELCFSCRGADAAGRPFSDFVEAPGGSGGARDAVSVLAAFSSEPTETAGIRADGSRFPAEVALSEAPLGERRIYTAFVIDLTGKREAEQEIQRQRDTLYQREKLAAMGSLLAGVAHELNNPLSVVVGRSLMLEEELQQDPPEVSDDQVRDAIERIRQAAERCARIVKTFLSMARQHRPERRLVDMNRLIEVAASMLGYTLRTAGIDVQLRLDPAVPRVLADEDQFHQVLMNLMVNAQQAMADRQGPRRLTVSTRLDRIAQRIAIDVVDTGPGIAPEHRGRVFEPYFTTKPQGQGTGVGLSVCLGIVEAHGGTLVFDCPPTGGTRFTIDLPLVAERAAIDEGDQRRSTAGPTALARDPVERVTSSTARPQLLVVDDEPELAAMLRDILAAQGEVTLAYSGLDAIEQLRRQHFDLVLTDLRMPELDGPGLYRNIVTDWPALRDHVIFLTGDALSTNVRTFLADQHCPVIEKPFRAGEVRDLVARMLAARPAPTPGATRTP